MGEQRLAPRPQPCSRAGGPSPCAGAAALPPRIRTLVGCLRRPPLRRPRAASSLRRRPRACRTPLHARPSSTCLPLRAGSAAGICPHHPRWPSSSQQPWLHRHPRPRRDPRRLLRGGMCRPQSSLPPGPQVWISMTRRGAECRWRHPPHRRRRVRPRLALSADLPVSCGAGVSPPRATRPRTCVRSWVWRRVSLSISPRTCVRRKSTSPLSGPGRPPPQATRIKLQATTEPVRRWWREWALPPRARRAAAPAARRRVVWTASPSLHCHLRER
mmetsp:Transcript_14218/g.38283  ORF Transcript_14218/g.38283 Transcript_14218/m.38283 type:complete len:272 (+) Transcript_14218:198-1013(+)